MKQKTDIHVHAARKRLEVPFGNPYLPESHYICDPEEMRRTLTEQGIWHAILMSSGEGTCAGVHSLGAYNDDCREMAEESDGFFSWMCGLDPVSYDTFGERLAAYKARGAVGVGEVMFNVWMDDPYMTALADAAERLSMPVLCHMSPAAGFAYGVADHPGLPLLEKILASHPDLIMIGHSQVFWMEISADCPKEGNEERNGFGRGPVAAGGTVERLMDAYPNLYADLSAFSGSCAIMRDEDYGLYFLEKFRDRLLFGTDTTNTLTRFPLASFIEQKTAEGRIAQATADRIFFENAGRLFGI